MATSTAVSTTAQTSSPPLPSSPAPPSSCVRQNGTASTTFSIPGWPATSIDPPAISPSPSGRACTTSSAASQTFASCTPSPAAPTWSSSPTAPSSITASPPSPASTAQQRRAETAYLRRWLISQGFLLWETPRETPFEGEGDVAFNDDGTALWAAHGVRTCRAAHRHVADAWHVPVTSLHLSDPRFYHLDTCFTPLASPSGEATGYLLYYPEAFDAASNAAIERAYPANRRIAVSELDATHMACCALNLGRTVFTGEITRELATRLFDAGFDVVQLELSEFIKGGGGAKSLALRLSDLPTTHTRLGLHPVS